MAEIIFEWDQWNVQKNEIKHGASRLESRVLMVGFTRRGRKIRVITARAASRKERRIYDEEV